MKRWLPTTFAGQTVLVLVVGLTVSHLLSMTIYSSDRLNVQALASGRQVSHQIAAITQLLSETPAEWRERIVRAHDGPAIRVTMTPKSALVAGAGRDWRTDAIRTELQELVPRFSDDRVTVQILEIEETREAQAESTLEGLWEWLYELILGKPTHQSLRVSVRLDDGKWLNFATVLPESGSLWSSRAILSMTLMAIGVILLSLWVVGRLTTPLSTFALAAERLGKDVDAPPLPETGPAELRRATHAFNEMQKRLRRLINNRTLMLAAVSHDLRTPITLLRLRAEFIEDEEEQRKMMATLDEMESMIASTLSFVREGVRREERRPVDLSALLASVCDDMADAGHPVHFEPSDKVAYECRATALRRALSNLIENAVKYGKEARVALASTDRSVEITIDDDGPGIPELELENVFTPFYRIERSRSRKTGGVGLGLSVARTIINAQGGDLALINRDGGGLRVRIELPR